MQVESANGHIDENATTQQLLDFGRGFVGIPRELMDEILVINGRELFENVDCIRTIVSMRKLWAMHNYAYLSVEKRTEIGSRKSFVHQVVADPRFWDLWKKKHCLFVPPNDLVDDIHRGDLFTLHARLQLGWWPNELSRPRFVPTASGGYTYQKEKQPLIEAIDLKGDLAIQAVGLLLHFKADPNGNPADRDFNLVRGLSERLPTGLPVLHAILKGKYEICKLLLSYKADPEFRTEAHAITPLQFVTRMEGRLPEGFTALLASYCQNKSRDPSLSSWDQ